MNSIVTSLTKVTLENGTNNHFQKAWGLNGTYLALDNGVSTMCQTIVLIKPVPCKLLSMDVVCQLNNMLKILLLMQLKMMLSWYSLSQLDALIILIQTTQDPIDSKEMEPK